MSQGRTSPASRYDRHYKDSLVLVVSVLFLLLVCHKEILKHPCLVVGLAVLYLSTRETLVFVFEGGED